MKIRIDKMNWSKSCYKPHFDTRYFSGKMWIFSIYKYSITFDFRKGHPINWLLTKSEQKRFWRRMWLKSNITKN